MAYTAFVLSNKSRSEILNRFPPKFPDVIAHHITENPGVAKEHYYTPNPADIKVVGYACDDSLEAIVVEVNGDTKRPKGGTYHITLSLDRSQGRQPRHSNDVIKNNGWTPTMSFSVETTPKLIE